MATRPFSSPATYTPPVRIAVIGLGSVLMGDDALGPHVVRRLEAAWSMPEGVDLLDLGTPGPEFSQYVMNYDALVIVDTVKAKGEPGEIRRYEKHELARALPSPRLSPHDPNLREALLTADFAGSAPRDVTLLGVVPGVVKLSTGLSPELAAALPRIEKAVLTELERLGRIAAPREPAGRPDIWWER